MQQQQCSCGHCLAPQSIVDEDKGVHSDNGSNFAISVPELQKLWDEKGSLSHVHRGTLPRRSSRGRILEKVEPADHQQHEHQRLQRSAQQQ